MKIIGIGGEPATGKSSVVQCWALDGEKISEQVITANNGKVIKKTLKQHRVGNLVIFGHYGDDIAMGGTDTLSMSILPAAIQWVRSRANDKTCNYDVIFEGDRLFNSKFITFLKEYPQVEAHFYILQAAEPILNERHAKRGDNQDEIFLKGRNTKYKRLIEQFPDIKVRTNNTMNDRLEIIREILGILGR